MKVAERNVFIRVPQRTMEDELQTNLGQWLQLRQKYGSDLPEDHVRFVFHNILPVNALADIRKHRDLDSLQQPIN